MKPPGADADMLSLTFTPDEGQAGFRLYRLEVYNWGTFHGRLWSIAPLGNNALLTGDIGSGKSTLVDALTTLLVPSQKITFNKAAGAQGKERSLTSYVRGYYKTSKDDGAYAAKPVALRDESNYSVLVAQFYNPGFAQWVSLAQLFWFQGGEPAPKKLWIVAEKPLTIAESFSKFSDVKALRKRLRSEAGVHQYESFKEYSADFCRRMGIDNPQAIDLLYQTVSMKSVGNLTDFVREHMLEGGDVESRVEAIVREFQNLNEAHEAVLRAKRQIELLQPIENDSAQVEELIEHRNNLRACREGLAAFFDGLKAELLEERINRREEELKRFHARLRVLRQDLEDLRRYERQLELSIAEKGGRRLTEIETETQRLARERDRRKGNAERYTELCSHLGFSADLASEPFVARRGTAKEHLDQTDKELQACKSQQIEFAIRKKERNDAIASIDAELTSLRERRSNIPANMLRLRQDLCEALGVSPDTVPFAGELLQVNERERAWEGAAERVLHGFALSLLVSEEEYAAVTQYVDRTHLRGRLVYYRVPRRVEVPRDLPGKQSLFYKLDIKRDSAFAQWLERTLIERFDYHCCDSLDDFRRYPMAVTRNGQIRTRGGKHEKNDSYDIADRSRYVLGWDNKAKIEALARKRDGEEKQLAKIRGEIEAVAKRNELAGARRDALRDFLGFTDFAELDWMTPATAIQRLAEEQRILEDSADGLRKLREEFKATQAKIAGAQKDVDTKQKEDGMLQEKLEADRLALDAAKESLNAISEADRIPLFERLAILRTEAQGDARLTIENCDNRQKDMRGWLQGKLDALDKQFGRLVEKIVEAMGRFKHDYPVDAAELDASIDAAPEFKRLLARLQSEDLPRHEEHFRRMLKEGTINGIALFQSQLERERMEIEEKVRKINASLQAIDYNPGTYIKLVVEGASDPEIRQFRQDLRACLGDSLAANFDDLYTEEKFQQVKALVARFKGREGTAELDKRWTRKVTDVRNWFAFSASERWRADDVEKEHYQDAAGKSGGQKEKLAYTILASALAYQFGLSWGETRSRSFRFAMIDEAFGRGSDDSARYALGLFQRLNLQLLIVTPLQKIHVIEDYVRTVNFVHNVDGSNSMIRNLSIEQYRAEKAGFKDKPLHA